MIGGYLRVSTRGQAKRQTIELQRDAFLEHCAQRGEVGEQFVDDGKSSRMPLFDRPGGKRMFEWAKERKLQELIVYSYDRLGRDDDDVTTLVAMGELRKFGVKIISLTEASADDGLGRILASLGVLIGGQAREKTRKLTRTGTNKWVKLGTYQGGPVRFGYCVVPSPTLSTPEKPRLVLAPATNPMPGFENPPLSEADVARQIFERVAAGDSQQTVVDNLNARGIPLHPAAQAGLSQWGKRKTRLGTQWTATRIGAMIRDPIYKGMAFYGRLKVDWSTGVAKAVKRDDPTGIKSVPCPPIVSEEFWEKACAVLRLHNNRLRAHADNHYLLSGMIRCGTCGRAYIGRTPNGRKIYCCGAHYGWKLLGLPEACPSKNVNGRNLEAFVWEHIRRYVRSPGLAHPELEANLTDTQSKQATIRDIKRVEGTIARQEAERDRVITLFRKGGLISEAQLERQFADMDAEKVTAEAELARLQQELKDTGARQRRQTAGRELLYSLRDKVESMVFDERRAAVEALVDEITVQADGTADVTFVFEPHFERDIRRWNRPADTELAKTLRLTV